jgi:hypothetical protein
MNHQMSGTQKFILALTGLIVLGIGLSRISVAQQPPAAPGEAAFSTLRANRIYLTDKKGKIRMVLQAEDLEEEGPEGQVYQSIDKGPCIFLIRGGEYVRGGPAMPECHITSTSITFWDTWSPERHPLSAILFPKVFLGLDEPNADGRMGPLVAEGILLRQRRWRRIYPVEEAPEAAVRSSLERQFASRYLPRRNRGHQGQRQKARPLTKALNTSFVSSLSDTNSELTYETLPAKRPATRGSRDSETAAHGWISLHRAKK